MTQSPLPFAPDLIERLQQRFERSPAQNLLGVRVVSIDLDYAELTLDFLPVFDNGGGAIHGGVLAMLADTAVACALSTNFDGRMGFATASLNIHYLKRAKSGVLAKARIVKKGGTVCVGAVDIFDQSGALVATCTTDFVLTTNRGSLQPAVRA